MSLIDEAKNQVDEIDNPAELDRILTEVEDNLSFVVDATGQVSRANHACFVESSGAVGDVVFSATETLDSSNEQLKQAELQLSVLKEYVEDRMNEL